MFEAHAAEAIGGYLPQIRMRTLSGQFLVVWQGAVERFRNHPSMDDTRAAAEGTAELRIVEVVIGLFQDQRMAKLAAALTAGDDAQVKQPGPDAARITPLEDGTYEVSDGKFAAQYDDARVAAAVARWLANEDDTRKIDDVIASAKPSSEQKPAPASSTAG